MISLAQTLLDAKADLPTNLGTADLRKLGADILRQSLFSARMTNAQAVQGIRDAITRILSSVPSAGTSVTSDNLAEARLKLKQLGAALDYDPAHGFPGDKDIPPAEAGDLRDLYSTDRLNLVLKTQQQLVQGAAKKIWGNEPDALEQYPAWELVRVEAREVPRGEKRTKDGIVEVPEDSWEARWQAACEESGDDDALKILQDNGRIVARKDSPAWLALSAGAGGYTDNIDNHGAGPFGFNSGKDQVEVSAQEFEDLGGDASGIRPSETEIGPDEVRISKSRFDPDILRALKSGLESGDLKFRVKVEVT